MPQRLTYSNQGGSPELQHALVEYLRVARSVHCSPEQILITEGIHQAIDLVTRMLCNPGMTPGSKSRAIGDPQYPAHQCAEHLPAGGGRSRAGTAGAADQPTAADLRDPVAPVSARLGDEPARRQRLLALARNAGGWIVEDDYDSEFRFSGQPIPALQGLEADAPVIYIGTFSKTLYPALRLGYVVLPPPLVQALKTAHAELYRGGHLLIQSALAEFIQAGHYTAHIRRMRLLYARRRAFLTGLIEQHLGKQALSEFNSNAGLHLILNLPDEADDVAIAAAAGAQGCW